MAVAVAPELMWTGVPPANWKELAFVLEDGKGGRDRMGHAYVDDTEIHEEASAPDHVRDGIVYECRPKLSLWSVRDVSYLSHGEQTHEYERNQRQYPSPLASSSNRNRTDCRLENQLEETKQDSWDRAHRFRKHIAMKRIFEITKDIAAVTVR